MAVEMHVPNKSYDGYFGGVRFFRGIGKFEDEKAAKELADKYGFKIVEKEKPSVEPKKEEKKEEPKKPVAKKRKSKKAGE